MPKQKLKFNGSNELRTDYKNDVFEGNRLYQIAQEGEYYSVVEKTTFKVEGDTYGAEDINATNKVVNFINSILVATLTTSWTLDETTNKYYQDIAIENIDANNQIDVFPNCLDLTAEEEETYLEQYNKLCSNNQTIEGGLRVYANEQTESEIQIELRLVK